MSIILSFSFTLLGAILASFAGVISERINTGDSWFSGRSRCNSCNRVLSFPDLIPFFSFVWSGGKCRTCKARVPYRYALTEVILAVLYFASYRMLGLTLPLLIVLVFLFLLTVIVLYDLQHTIVPLPLALLLILTGALYLGTTWSDTSSGFWTVIVAGIIGLAFFLMYALSKGRWMGLGDAPIAFALSLVAGHQALAGLLFSFWIGGAIGIVILVLAPRGHRMGIEVPFVPFLAAGYLLAFFTGWNPLPF